MLYAKVFLGLYLTMHYVENHQPDKCHEEPSHALLPAPAMNAVPVNLNADSSEITQRHKGSGPQKGAAAAASSSQKKHAGGRYISSVTGLHVSARAGARTAENPPRIRPAPEGGGGFRNVFPNRRRGLVRIPEMFIRNSQVRAGS